MRKLILLWLLCTHILVAQKRADPSHTGDTQSGNELFIPPFKQVSERFPQYPLKTRRMIYKDEDLLRARENVARYPEARNVRDKVLKAADQWLAWTDSDLRDIMADARVPRAFDLNPKGSPVHGDKVFKVGGTYPWIVDPRHPFQVKSPIDGQMFPGNDYAAYYKSNFKDKKGWDSAYADDGWGWVAPDGERYWFVAYANHWTWKAHIEPAMADLGRAYLLTGDKRYAHKAAVMLHRLAEVYPSMDHANQSRYGLMERAKGRIYDGKVMNLIWEASLIQNAAEAYDAVWESIDGDSELQRLCGKTGEQIRSFIEANVLEDALDAYLQRKIQGNYGMHQTALLYILLARQNMDTEKYLRMIVEEPGESRVQSGIRYALYNMIFRDGQPLEAPLYNMLTVEKMAKISEMLNIGGMSLFQEPRLRYLINSPLAMVAAGKFTPDIGDSGSVLGGLIGQDPDVYQIGYKMYKDPAYLTWLSAVNKVGGHTFSGFGSLFREVLPEVAPLPDHRAVTAKPSRLLAGYGLGILNNHRDVTALSFNYGFKGTHYHWDFLNFELFANGQKMMPDLGYPDAMNEYVKEVYTWSFNTVGHHAVVVDSQRQLENLPGTLHDFSSGTFARSMDASSRAYPQTTAYRRNLIMVDVDSMQSYVVDVFRVSGGTRHDYSLHGPPGEVSYSEGKWGRKQPGTLAGKDVEFGQIYDDARMGARDYAGSYWNYKGSGYQYLFNVQRLESGKGIVQYKHTLSDSAQLRIHILPSSGQEVVLADAYDKPRAKTNLIKYMIARRKATGTKPLQSTFVGVMEPYSVTHYIQNTNLLQLQNGTGAAIEVIRNNATDVVVSDTANTVKIISTKGIETDANAAVVTFDPRGNVTRIYFSDGSYLKVKGKEYRAEQLKGTVTEVDFTSQTLKIKYPGGTLKGNLTGSAVHFTNAYRTTVHPLQSVQVNHGELSMKMQDDLLVGKVHIQEANADSIVTDTNLPFAPLYSGTTILNSDFKVLGILKSIRENKLLPAGKLISIPGHGNDIWLSDVGVGDQVTIKSSFSWER